MLDKTRVRAMIKKASKRFIKAKLEEIGPFRTKVDRTKSTVTLFYGPRLIARITLVNKTFEIFGRKVSAKEFIYFVEWLQRRWGSLFQNAIRCVLKKGE